MIEVKVTDKEAGTRLDKLLAQKMAKQLSRASVIKLIERGRVTHNGALVSSKSIKVKSKDTIKVDYQPLTIESGSPETDAIEIIHQDDNQIVINKPAGVLSHAKGALPQELSVADWLQPHTTDLESGRSGIVHRLDRATSGAMILAKNPKSKSWLMKQFSDRSVHKKYLAIIEGDPNDIPDLVKNNAFQIDLPIERNPKKPTTFHVAKNGRPSQTIVQILYTDGQHSLVLLQPKTGRTHQLRVHMASNGWPIVGDPFYNPNFKNGQKLMLHAFSLTIQILTSGSVDNFTKEWQHFSAMPSEHFLKFTGKIFPKLDIKKSLKEAENSKSDPYIK